MKYTFIDEDSIEFNRYPKSFLMSLCSESNSFKSTCFSLSTKINPYNHVIFNALLQNNSVLFTRNYCFHTCSELECCKAKKNRFLQKMTRVVLSLPYFDRSAVSEMHISLSADWRTHLWLGFVVVDESVLITHDDSISVSPNPSNSFSKYSYPSIEQKKNNNKRISPKTICVEIFDWFSIPVA